MGGGGGGAALDLGLGWDADVDAGGNTRLYGHTNPVQGHLSNVLGYPPPFTTGGLIWALLDPSVPCKFRPKKTMIES